MNWIVVTGDRDWRDPAVIVQWLDSLKQSQERLGLVVDTSKVGVVAGQWAFDNSVPLEYHQTDLTSDILERDCQGVLVFHNFVDGSHHSLEMTKAAEGKDIPVVLVNRKGAQYYRERVTE